MTRILVAEDTKLLAQGIRSALEQEGYEVRIVADGLSALDTIRSWLPRLIILDLGLPSLDGLQLLRRIRDEHLLMPVIILSARTSEPDRVRGLRIGADDYLTKPFSLDELLARVDAHLRRELRAAAGRPAVGPDSNVAEGRLVVSAATRSAAWDGVVMPLTPRQFDLLHALARRRGDVATRVELLREVWGYESDVESRTVDTHVAELRRKLEVATASSAVLVTVRKAGYRLLVRDEAL